MTVCSAGEVILMGKAQYLPVAPVAVGAALGVVLDQEAALLPQEEVRLNELLVVPSTPVPSKLMTVYSAGE